VTPAARVATAVPVRAEGVELLGEMDGSGYRRPPALVRRADGQTITLTPLLYLTLRAIDGRRGYDDAATALTAVSQRHVTADDVAYLVEEKLRPRGLIRGHDGSEPRTTKANPLLALRLKLVVSSPTLTRRVTAPFAWLFHPVVALPVLALFAVVSWWILFDEGLASATHQAFYEPSMILTVWALVVLSAGFHEFGHAAACRYGGATPGVMGAGLYLVWPAFYTEVTDSYRLGRGGRLRVDLGGLYFNAIFALATLATWAALRWDALLLVVVAQHLQMARQLAPFIRADGYHIVADLTGVPDLFAHIKPTLLSVLPGRWRPQSAGTPALTRWARLVVVAWVALVVPLLAGLVAMAVVFLPRLAATAWDSMGRQWAAADGYWLEGDALGVLVQVMSTGLVALPVLGLCYLLARILRRTTLSAWSATRGRPVTRAGLMLAAVGVAAGIAWAWWPADQYRPIEGDQAGTLPDLVSQEVEDRRVFVPLLYRTAPIVFTVLEVPAPVQPVADPVTSTSVGEPVPTAPSTDEVGAVGTATSVLQGPSSVHDARGGDTSQSPPPLTGTEEPQPGSQDWPFPFPRPPAPSPGDNRAEAVNTTDGSVQTDLAVAWAIVTANEVDTRNEAYALASCRDCATMAVAFQVLLLVGDVQVITPVNAAVAVNYECDTCLTQAIAVQLVVTLTGMPSQDAQQQIAAVMDQVQDLEIDLASLSSGQIYYLLQASQAEIMRVLSEDGVLPELPPGTVEPAEEASAVPVGSEPSSSPETVAGATEPSADSSTGSDIASPESDTATTPSTATSEPTVVPSPEPTAESTAESTAEPSEAGSTTEPTAETSSAPAPTATTSSP
jgi:putative peptide zinc metalloprotease protein